MSGVGSIGMREWMMIHLGNGSDVFAAGVIRVFDTCFLSVLRLGNG